MPMMGRDEFGGAPPSAAAMGPGVQPSRETTTTTTSVVGTMMRPPMQKGQISTIYEGHIIEHRGPGQRPILHKSVTDVIRDRGTLAPDVRHDIAREPLQRPGVTPAGHVTPITAITPRTGKPGMIGETTTIHHPGSLGAITSTQTKTEMAVPSMSTSLMAKLKRMLSPKSHTTTTPAEHNPNANPNPQPTGSGTW